jgi:glycosyltransferase involved in cell wall biosynthesis
MRLLVLAHAPSVHTQRWAGAFAARGHDVRLLSVVVAPGAAFPGESVGDAEAPIPFWRYASARSAVRAVLASWKPDITVAHFLPNYGFLAALAGARPFALVAWGSDLLINARRSPLHAARARWVLRRAALTHVDAANLAAAARSLGAPTATLWMRPWGVDADALASTASWAERVRKAGTLRVLWTRMLEPIYDPTTFLAALAALKRRGEPFRATIAGDGPLRSALEAASLRHGIGDAVRFEGMVDEARLRALYREHEVYVSMSRSDSTSQSLLEAMAAGLYPVVSDIPGNEPWIGARGAADGARRDRGFAVPVGDAEALTRALAEVRADDAASDRVARGAARVRAEANWSDTIRECEQRLHVLAEAARR